MIPHEAIRLFAKTLGNLEKWMDEAGAYANERSFDVDVLAQARLAPDQFTFVQQVQAACDQAKYAAAYLAGKPAPSHPDTSGRTLFAGVGRHAGLEVHGRSRNPAVRS